MATKQVYHLFSPNFKGRRVSKAALRGDNVRAAYYWAQHQLRAGQTSVRLLAGMYGPQKS